MSYDPYAMDFTHLKGPVQVLVYAQSSAAMTTVLGRFHHPRKKLHSHQAAPSHYFPAFQP